MSINKKDAIKNDVSVSGSKNKVHLFNDNRIIKVNMAFREKGETGNGVISAPQSGGVMSKLYEKPYQIPFTQLPADKPYEYNNNNFSQPPNQIFSPIRPMTIRPPVQNDMVDVAPQLQDLTNSYQATPDVDTTAPPVLNPRQQLEQSIMGAEEMLGQTKELPVKTRQQRKEETLKRLTERINREKENIQMGKEDRNINDFNVPVPNPNERIVQSEASSMLEQPDKTKIFPRVPTEPTREQRTQQEFSEMRKQKNYLTPERKEKINKRLDGLIREMVTKPNVDDETIDKIVKDIKSRQTFISTFKGEMVIDDDMLDQVYNQARMAALADINKSKVKASMTPEYNPAPKEFKKPREYGKK